MHIIRFEDIDSTQEHAKRITINPPFVVIADKQTAGRGRYNRKWYSPSGGVWMTYVDSSDGLVHPSIPLVLSFAVSNFLEREGIECLIKPPNDVYSKAGKICGILVEYYKDKILAGIGLNVNIEYFPHYINASSMYIETGKKYDLEEIINLLIQAIREVIEIFKTHGFKYFLADMKNKMDIWNKEIKIETTSGWFVGKVMDIDEDANLVIISTHGKPFIINLKEVVKII